MAEIIVTVVLEVGKWLAPCIQSQISYLRGYNNNLENLRNEIQKLKGDSASVQHKVDEAKRNGEEIEEIVEKWLARVKEVILEAETFVVNEATANSRCLNGLCPNLKTRLRRSKEAVRLLEAISKLGEAYKGFGPVSYSIIPEDTRIMPNKDYDAIESRMSTLDTILDALKNPDINMIGIYGMGGIGKTTLAKEVARQAKSDKLFHHVIFVEVSQSKDIRKMQGEIADILGCKLTEESDLGRANKLRKIMKENQKILIILDNVWEKLDLRVVGIPHGDDHKGCKILLTARSVNVLSTEMDSQYNFSIDFLREEEVWNLFKKKAGDYVETSEFNSVAREVAKKCAGLPVSIVTVASALRNQNLFVWRDALNKLKKPSSRSKFEEIQQSACTAIKWSYDKLQGEELKKIFLLIAYTYVTSIDTLLMYGIGLGLFEGIDKLEEARDRVRT